ncbi:MAG: hypothetical protein SPL80_03385 [Bacilli bacterium]|nr:hypothetical protein [Bacilli bacterium]
MDSKKRDYCIRTLNEHAKGLSPQDLFEEYQTLIQSLSPEQLEALMERFGEDPDDFVYQEGNEVIDQLFQLDEVRIDVFYENYHDDTGEPHFHSQKEDELFHRAVLLMTKLVAEDFEQAYAIAKKLYSIEYTYDFYEPYSDECYDSDIRSFADVYHDFFRLAPFEEILSQGIPLHQDYPAFTTFLQTVPEDKTLARIDPGFFDDYLTYIENRSDELSLYSREIIRIYSLLKQEALVQHFYRIAPYNGQVLSLGLKQIDLSLDLAPTVYAYHENGSLGNNRESAYFEAVARYPEEDDFVRFYYENSFQGDLQRVFLFLSLNGKRKNDLSSADQEYFNTKDSYHVSSRDHCEIIRLLMHCPRNASDPFEARISRGEKRFLELVDFDLSSYLEFLKDSLIHETSLASSNRYPRLIVKARFYTKACEGQVDFVETLLLEFPRRPALFRAAKETPDNRAEYEDA